VRACAPTSNSAYPIRFGPHRQAIRGLALVNERFVSQLKRGKIELSMLHAVVRMRWEILPDTGTPSIDIGLMLPLWMELDGSQSEVYAEVITTDRQLIWLRTSPGSRFMLKFPRFRDGKIKYDSFTHKDPRRMLITTANYTVIVGENTELFQANPFLVRMIGEL